MLSDYQRVYREGLERRKEACAAEMESLNTRANLEIQEYLQPEFQISIRQCSGQIICKKFTSFESTLLEQCSNGFHSIEYIVPRFHDTVKNTKGNSLNIVTGKYRIQGHNCEGFKGSMILEEIQKMLDPGILVSIEILRSQSAKVVIEIPI